MLIFVDWYLPGYKAGGPIQSCANLVAQLKQEYDFSIVCRDSDFTETRPYPGIKSDRWTVIEKGVRIWYISVSELKGTTIKKHLNHNYDVLYLNSLFSRYFTILPLRLNKKIKKVVLAPRGMLGSGALGIKPLKKKLFLAFAKITGLYSGITWQASTVQEEAEIRAVFGTSPHVVTALNLPPLKKLEFHSRKKESGILRLFFLSRISIKKNLLTALDYLSQLKSDETVSLDIIGAVEDKPYWELCLQKINEMKKSKPNVSINVVGPIENKNLQLKLIDYHALILPTQHENFGHVILEALACGCLVIISDQTPWRNLRERKIGWDLSLSEPEKFVSAIEDLVAMKEKEFNELSLNAFKEAEKFYNNKELLDQNRRLFG